MISREQELAANMRLHMGGSVMDVVREVIPEEAESWSVDAVEIQDDEAYVRVSVTMKPRGGWVHTTIVE